METGKSRRSTPQRRIILEELCSLDSHPTAAELHDIVRRRLPRISLGTVYRNLEVLMEEGLVRKLALAGTEARFDGTVEPHFHIRCIGCGIIRDFHGAPPAAVPDPAVDLDGFTVQGCRIEYYGLCSACKITKTV